MNHIPSDKHPKCLYEKGVLMRECMGSGDYGCSHSSDKKWTISNIDTSTNDFLFSMYLDIIGPSNQKATTQALLRIMCSFSNLNQVASIRNMVHNHKLPQYNWQVMMIIISVWSCFWSHSNRYKAAFLHGGIHVKDTMYVHCSMGLPFVESANFAVAWDNHGTDVTVNLFKWKFLQKIVNKHGQLSVWMSGSHPVLNRFFPKIGGGQFHLNSFSNRSRTILPFHVREKTIWRSVHFLRCVEAVVVD